MKLGQTMWNLFWDSNIFISYKKPTNLNKRKVEGYYSEYFMQVMNLKIILLMHFCQKLVPHMQVVIYP